MPKQNKAQNTGRLGERWFPQQLPANWIFQPPREDIGIDGVVVICEDSPSNGLEFHVQIKSSEEWKVHNESILLRVKKHNLNYWLAGFNPTLVVLYDTSRNIGWYSWVNQLIAEDISALKGESKTVLLSIPINRKLDASIWNIISRQLHALHQRIAKRIIVTNMALPVMETTRWLMQSLRLIDICAHNWPEDLKDFNKKMNINDLNCRNDLDECNELVDTEITAHKEIAQALFELDRKLNEAGIPNTGAKDAAQKYCDVCARFIKDFHKYIEHSGSGFQTQVDVKAMFGYRNQAVREVTQIVSNLSSLSLSIVHDNKASPEKW